MDTRAGAGADIGESYRLISRPVPLRHDEGCIWTDGLAPFPQTIPLDGVIGDSQ